MIGDNRTDKKAVEVDDEALDQAEGGIVEPTFSGPKNALTIIGDGSIDQIGGKDFLLHKQPKGIKFSEVDMSKVNIDPTKG